MAKPGFPRLLPFVLVAVLLAAAVAAFWRRQAADLSSTLPKAPAPQEGPVNPPADPASASFPSPPPPSGNPPAAVPLPRADAKLRVTLLAADQDIDGFVTSSAEGRKGEAFVAVSGRGRAEAVFPSLSPGRKTIVFLARSEHATAAAEVTLISGKEGTLEIPLRQAQAFRGIVVDALRRPLAGVRVKASAAGVFIPREASGPVIPLQSIRSLSAAGRTDSSPRSFRSSSVYSDGRVVLGTETDAAGRFRIPGLPGPSVAVEVGEAPAHLARTCLVETEAYLIVPVVPDPIPESETKESLRGTLEDLVDRLGRDPQPDAAYWVQIKDQLRKSVEESRLSALDKMFLRELVDTLGRKTDPDQK